MGVAASLDGDLDLERRFGLGVGDLDSRAVEEELGELEDMEFFRGNRLGDRLGESGVESTPDSGMASVDVFRIGFFESPSPSFLLTDSL